METLIMQAIDTIFTVAILVMSVVIHEVSHGFAALREGDETAKYAGRLTLNPLRHLDLFGSFIVPLILTVLHTGFPFGWAKPVPYNENNLRDKRWGTLRVAAAGIIANFSIAIIFGIIVRLAIAFGLIIDPASPILHIMSLIVLVNIGLGVFNLIPIPPLDGSKILFSLVGPRIRGVENFMTQYAIIIVAGLIFIIYYFDFISPLVLKLFSLMTGFS